MPNPGYARQNHPGTQASQPRISRSNMAHYVGVGRVGSSHQYLHCRVETRRMKAALAARINKTDRIDARGIAQMMRVGLYRSVHGKSNARVRQLVEDLPGLTAIIRPLLEARAAIRRSLLSYTPVIGFGPRRSSVPATRECYGRRRCRVDHLPGDGGHPTAITSSKAVGAHFGLTPMAFSSAETDYSSRISRCGDVSRTVLAQSGHDPDPHVGTIALKHPWLLTRGTTMFAWREGRNTIAHGLRSVTTDKAHPARTRRPR
jgi:hypothetical protein